MGLAPNEEVPDTQAHFLGRVHPDDLKRLEKADLDCIKGLTDRSVCEYRVRFPDGSWRWMRSDAVVAARDSSGQALRLIGAQMDVNDIHTTKEKLRRGEEKLRLVLSNAPVGMALISIDGGVHFANKAMADIAQCHQQEIVSQGLGGIFIRRGPDEIKDAITLVHSGKGNIYRSEKLLLRRDGSAIWAIVSLAPISMDSEHRDEFVLLVQDITDKKEIEKLRANFFATVSHEMRTPVTSINGALSLVAGAFSHELSDESKKLIDISIMNSTRLVTLVNEILDLEKISDDGVSFDFSNERLGEVVTAAVRQIEPYASKYKVRVEAHVHDTDCVIRTDRRRLDQVVSNLLSNACKFSKPDGVVRLTTKAFGTGTVSISVTDEGVGIPESFRAKIFEPFSQGHLDHLHSKQGSGLGLSIARKIVVSMGGEISFQSEPGRGTEFWFTCPIASPSAIESAT
jgi:PAS domain S-box-containing protein